jgi:serine/threonine protein kinase
MDLSSFDDSPSAYSADVVTAPAIPHLRAVRYAHDAVNVDEPFSFPTCFHQVKGILGAGSYGIVYLVEMDDPRMSDHPTLSHGRSAGASPATRALFAAKYIPLRRMDMRNLLRVVREVEMLTVFQFSSEIVETVKIFVDPNRREGSSQGGDDARALWIVMERFDHSLYHHYPPFRYGLPRLPLFKFQSVMADVFLGLALMHSEGCCHRDLSPKNILVSDDGHAALADFGLARFLNESHSYTTDGMVTILYRAPEVALGLKSYSTKVDVWSLGVLLAEYLLQRHLFQPFRNDDRSLLYEIFQKVGFPSDDDMAGPYSPVSFVAADYVGECQMELDADPNAVPFNLRDELTKSIAHYHQNDPSAVAAGDLCLALLRINPNERLTAEQGLAHNFFAGGREYINGELEHHENSLTIAREGRPPGCLFSNPGGTYEELLQRLHSLAPLLL